MYKYFYLLLGSNFLSVHEPSRRRRTLDAGPSANAPSSIAEATVDSAKRAETSVSYLMARGCLAEEIVHETRTQKAKRWEKPVVAQLVLGVGMSVASVMMMVAMTVCTVRMMQIYKIRLKSYLKIIIFSI